jgi:hypothetical protein
MALEPEMMEKGCDPCISVKMSGLEKEAFPPV